MFPENYFAGIEDMDFLTEVKKEWEKRANQRAKQRLELELSEDECIQILSRLGFTPDCIDRSDTLHRQTMNQIKGKQ